MNTIVQNVIRHGVLAHSTTWHNPSQPASRRWFQIPVNNSAQNNTSWDNKGVTFLPSELGSPSAGVVENGCMINWVNVCKVPHWPVDSLQTHARASLSFSLSCFWRPRVLWSSTTLKRSLNLEVLVHWAWDGAILLIHHQILGEIFNCHICLKLALLCS